MIQFEQDDRPVVDLVVCRKEEIWQGGKSWCTLLYSMVEQMLLVEGIEGDMELNKRGMVFKVDWCYGLTPHFHVIYINQWIEIIFFIPWWNVWDLWVEMALINLLVNIRIFDLSDFWKSWHSCWKTGLRDEN